MKKYEFEEIIRLAKEDQLPYSFECEGESMYISLSDSDDIFTVERDGRTILIGRPGTAKLVLRKAPEKLGLFLDLLERIRSVIEQVDKGEEENPYYLDPYYFECVVPTKIGQMAGITDIKKALEDLSQFSDEEILNAFLLDNQWAVYREWLKKR